MDVIPTIRTPASRDFYLAYLNSTDWRRRRTRVLQRVGHRCERCNSKRELQVHHKTYERLGAELESDLEVLCLLCHEGETIKQTEASDSRIYLKLASEALRVRPYDSIAELSEATKRLCAQHHVLYNGPEVHRAVELVTGTRLTHHKPQPKEDDLQPDPLHTSPAEAHEYLCRIGLQCGAIEFIVKPFPSLEKTPAEQAAHERTIARQIQEFKQQYPRARRRPIGERLDDIFAKDAR